MNAAISGPSAGGVSQSVTPIFSDLQGMLGSIDDPMFSEILGKILEEAKKMDKSSQNLDKLKSTLLKLKELLTKLENHEKDPTVKAEMSEDIKSLRKQINKVQNAVDGAEVAEKVETVSEANKEDAVKAEKSELKPTRIDQINGQNDDRSDGLGAHVSSAIAAFSLSITFTQKMSVTLTDRASFSVAQVTTTTIEAKGTGFDAHLKGFFKDTMGAQGSVVDSLKEMQEAIAEGRFSEISNMFSGILKASLEAVVGLTSLTLSGLDGMDAKRGGLATPAITVSNEDYQRNLEEAKKGSLEAMQFLRENVFSVHADTAKKFNETADSKKVDAFVKEYNYHYQGALDGALESMLALEKMIPLMKGIQEPTGLDFTEEINDHETITQIDALISAPGGITSVDDLQQLMTLLGSIKTIGLPLALGRSLQGLFAKLESQAMFTTLMEGVSKDLSTPEQTQGFAGQVNDRIKTMNTASSGGSTSGDQGEKGSGKKKQGSASGSGGIRSADTETSGSIGGTSFNPQERLQKTLQHEKRLAEDADMLNEEVADQDKVNDLQEQLAALFGSMNSFLLNAVSKKAEVSAEGIVNKVESM